MQQISKRFSLALMFVIKKFTFSLVLIDLQNNGADKKMRLVRSFNGTQEKNADHRRHYLPSKQEGIKFYM